MPEFLREMNDEAFQKYGDIMTVGEAPNCRTNEEALQYVRSSDPQLSMAFNFEVIALGTGSSVGKPKYESRTYKLTELKDRWTKIQTSIAGTDAWITSFLENHDSGRSVSRYADDSPEYWERSCKVLATLLATATGTLFIYQGQEIGMKNAPSSWGYEEFLDVEVQNYLKFVEDANPQERKSPESVRHGIQKLARDHARLPMQWDESPNAGFSSSKPWMRVHDEYKEINVGSQKQNPTSVLNFWRELLKLRKEHAELFVHGETVMIDAESEKIFAFIKNRSSEQSGQKAVVALNFSAGKEQWTAPEDIRKGSAKLLSCNYPSVEIGYDLLRPWESRIYLIG